MGDKVLEKWVILLGSKRKSWTDAIKPEPPLYLVNTSAVSLMHFDDIYPQDRFFCSWFVRYVLLCLYITFTFIQLLNCDTNTSYTMQKQRQCSSSSFYPMLLLYGADYSSSYLIQALCSSIQQKIDCISQRYGVHMVWCLSNW